MKYGLVRQVVRFSLLIAWSGVGLCAGGLVGGVVASWELSDATKHLPPPRDATWPMVIAFVLVGSAVGGILAQIGVALYVRRSHCSRQPEPNEN
jgi:hypothetical protein